MDLFSRKIISWKLSERADAAMVIDAFKTAYMIRQPRAGLMFHSDRGTQYTAAAFRMLLDRLNVTQSFSRKGYPYDNACCESFFKHMKREEIERRHFSDYRELHLVLLSYIDSFFNLKRPHASLDYLTPNEKERIYREEKSEGTVLILQRALNSSGSVCFATG